MAEPQSDIPLPSAPKPRIIKRYANRKLYDTCESRYVTLSQVASLVRAGEDLAILDNRTKEDLTGVTLAQIIYEAQKKAVSKEHHGARRLRDFIQVGGERLIAYLREGPSSSGDTHPLAAPALEALEELQKRADGQLRGLIDGALRPVQQLQDEVFRLQARVRELESSVIRRGSSATASAVEQSPEG